MISFIHTASRSLKEISCVRRARARQQSDTNIKILEFEYFGMKNDGGKDSRCDCIIPHGRQINCSANQKHTNAHTFGAKKTRKYGPSKRREKGRNQKNEKQTSIENLRQANSFLPTGGYWTDEVTKKNPIIFPPQVIFANSGAHHLLLSRGGGGAPLNDCPLLALEE